MSYINVTNIQLVNNPSTFSAPLTFQITFECLKELPDEVEWTLLYIGSSKDVKYDQILDSFSMGPLEYGMMQFDLESNGPDHSKIPMSEILGVTAIILSVSYRNQEFFRVGYYVYNFYADQELADNPPEEVQIDKVTRNVLADKPRITRFDIKWGDEKEENTMVEEGEQGSQLIAKENTDSFMEKMHLFMNDGEGSQSIASIGAGQNPFLVGGDQHNDLSKGFVPENAGFNLFAGSGERA